MELLPRIIIHAVFPCNLNLNKKKGNSRENLGSIFVWGSSTDKIKYWEK
jgi:hypothetical protein